MSLMLAGLAAPCDVRVDDPSQHRRTWPVGLNYVRRRIARPNTIVMHITGAEHDAAQVYQTLSIRGYSVHFVIDRAGMVWQFLDALWFTAAHTGGLNARSIGIEVVNIGRPVVWRKYVSSLWPNPYDRPMSAGWVHAVGADGKYVRSTRLPMLGLLPIQLASVKALVTALCAHTEVPLVRADSRPYVPRPEREALRGVLGHGQVTTAHGDPSVDSYEWLTEAG